MEGSIPSSREHTPPPGGSLGCASQHPPHPPPLDWSVCGSKAARNARPVLEVRPRLPWKGLRLLFLHLALDTRGCCFVDLAGLTLRVRALQ